MADDLIMRIGESVFGLTWESDMAIALDVSEDPLRRWAKGDEPPKPGLHAELAVFVAERMDELQGVAEELERCGTGRIMAAPSKRGTHADSVLVCGVPEEGKE